MLNIRGERRKAEEEKAKKDQEKIDKRNAIDQAYKDLFNSATGVIVMKDMAKDANHRKDLFALSTTERENNYLQGKQAIINRILKILED